MIYLVYKGIKKKEMKEIYKNWEIRKSDYAVGYYEATNLNDCDACMIHAKSVEEIKTEIDENEYDELEADSFINIEKDVHHPDQY